MSNTPFVESSSSDPVERAIARKVQRILNDKTLDRQRRETLVHKAQRELIEHRRRKEQQQTLTQQVAENAAFNITLGEEGLRTLIAALLRGLSNNA